jgi:hypothetical protein
MLRFCPAHRWKGMKIYIVFSPCNSGSPTLQAIDMRTKQINIINTHQEMFENFAQKARIVTHFSAANGDEIYAIYTHILHTHTRVCVHETWSKRTLRYTAAGLFWACMDMFLDVLISETWFQLLSLMQYSRINSGVCIVLHIHDVRKAWGEACARNFGQTSRKGYPKRVIWLMMSSDGRSRAVHKILSDATALKWMHIRRKWRAIWALIIEQKWWNDSKRTSFGESRQKANNQGKRLMH